MLGLTWRCAPLPTLAAQPPVRTSVAAGVPVPVAPAFANWPPLPPLPFESKGIPHSVGTFGESAVQVASQRRTRREDKGQVVVDVGE